MILGSKQLCRTTRVFSYLELLRLPEALGQEWVAHKHRRTTWGAPFVRKTSTLLSMLVTNFVFGLCGNLHRRTCGGSFFGFATDPTVWRREHVRFDHCCPIFIEVLDARPKQSGSAVAFFAGTIWHVHDYTKWPRTKKYTTFHRDERTQMSFLDWPETCVFVKACIFILCKHWSRAQCHIPCAWRGSAA